MSGDGTGGADPRAGALEELERAHGGMLRRWVRQFTVSWEDAEDAYQTVLCALWSNGRSLQGDALVSYVFAALQHEAAKQARRRARKPTESLGAHDPPAALGTEELVELRERIELVRTKVGCPVRRRVIFARGLGLGSEEISAATGVSHRGVRKRITAARAELAAAATGALDPREGAA